MPLTFLEVSAAGNASDKLKDTVIDKTIQAFEDGFNSLFTNTVIMIKPTKVVNYYLLVYYWFYLCNMNCITFKVILEI